MQPNRENEFFNPSFSSFRNMSEQSLSENGNQLSDLLLQDRDQNKNQPENQLVFDPFHRLTWVRT